MSNARGFHKSRAFFICIFFYCGHNEKSVASEMAKSKKGSRVKHASRGHPLNYQSVLEIIGAIRSRSKLLLQQTSCIDLVSARNDGDLDSMAHSATVLFVLADWQPYPKQEVRFPTWSSMLFDEFPQQANPIIMSLSP